MDIFDEAIVFACERHSGQTRKITGAPYILHPIEVATIVGTMTADREALAAAVLHDTVEDTPTTIEEIEEKFGSNISALVATETEDKRHDRPAAETWRIRKEESLEELNSVQDIRVKMIWLGDKLSNLRSLSREFKKSGAELWNSFNQKDPNEQKWYYTSVAEALKELENFDAYKEYLQCIEIIFS